MKIKFVKWRGMTGLAWYLPEWMSHKKNPLRVTNPKLVRKWDEGFRRVVGTGEMHEKNYAVLKWWLENIE